MIHLPDSTEYLEQQEDQIKQAVTQFSQEKAKRFYELQSQAYKDPDTYAVLILIFGMGLNLAYLNKHPHFIAYVLYWLLTVVLLTLNPWLGVVLLPPMVCLNTFWLFYAQRITRQHNLEQFKKIFDQIKEAPA